MSLSVWFHSSKIVGNAKSRRRVPGCLWEGMKQRGKEEISEIQRYLSVDLDTHNLHSIDLGISELSRIYILQAQFVNYN